ncbi:MAG: VWA domain-containing protein [Beijerinckiaceae bacterium]|nr:VWA domain-containing protein [Beijerinckiaceae bacterium]
MVRDLKTQPGSSTVTGTGSSAVSAFLDAVNAMPAVAAGARGKLVIALDATMSRQPTWDLACALQADMFRTAASIGGLAIQLVYFRGLAECRASQYVADPQQLSAMMGKIRCEGGQTQIGRVLDHLRDAATRDGVRAFVYVGDAMEESADKLLARAGEIGLLGLRGFIFQEGHDPEAERVFRDIARLTGGAYARFDHAAPGALAELLRAAAAYAAGGRDALLKVAQSGGAGHALLKQLR